MYLHALSGFRQAKKLESIRFLIISEKVIVCSLAAAMLARMVSLAFRIRLLLHPLATICSSAMPLSLVGLSTRLVVSSQRTGMRLGFKSGLGLICELSIS